MGTSLQLRLLGCAILLLTAPGLPLHAGELRVEIPSGTSLFCPPDAGDGRLDGELGRRFSGLVDKIHLRETGTTNVAHLTPGPDGAWVDEQGNPYARPLEPGQGFVIERASQESAHIPWPISTNTAVVTLREGLQIIGFPGDQPTALATAFEPPVAGVPVASFDETKADEIDLLNPDGSWRRLLRMPPGIWYDTKTGTNTTLVLAPGQAVYYQRQPGAGLLQIRPMRGGN